MAIFFTACKSDIKEKNLLPDRQLSENFKSYWFAGEAEITTYELEQSRYSEAREGTAVLIYVTEDFVPDLQVKADSQNQENIPVLKLNATKNFITGIYPYSIMESTFYPLEGNSHALKITASIQEWCGQVYMQLNNRKGFDLVSHSYFQKEADQNLSLSNTYLENELWTQLRVDPNQLPVGEFEIIPAMQFIRLAHIDIKAYSAKGEFFQDEKWSVYQIKYPELKRELRIWHDPNFPYSIEKWEEIILRDGVEHKTTGSKMAQIKSAYWNKNSNKDLPLRDTLNLN
ncbi:septum formation inhibitor Maf [Antarcticibacterium arcticum]|uniref:Septum formation inhibitor Maf n=1 Tax=Antarcticibacterium arcticum TaxID=2585771 RepID=A0A5B8YRA9_9FLAO|nr:septum formation inhibitor Maf [Antarcticibacterium arcticum]